MDPFLGATITQVVFSQDNTFVYLLSSGLYAFVVPRNGSIVQVGESAALRLRISDVETRLRTAVRDTLPESQEKPQRLQ